MDLTKKTEQLRSDQIRWALLVNNMISTTNNSISIKNIGNINNLNNINSIDNINHKNNIYIINCIIMCWPLHHLFPRRLETWVSVEILFLSSSENSVVLCMICFVIPKKKAAFSFMRLALKIMIQISITSEQLMTMIKLIVLINSTTNNSILHCKNS